MPLGVPCVACIGIIGKANQPLHMSLFPATRASNSTDTTTSTTTSSTTPSSQTPASPPPGNTSVVEEPRDALEHQFLLSSALDIFAARAPHHAASHDFGLLQALDERSAMYGWLSNTGVKYVVVIDMQGRPPATAAEARHAALVGVKDTDFKHVWRALQRAYARLLRNPFYVPDADVDGENLGGHGHGQPWPLGEWPATSVGPAQITSPAFIKEVERIGKAWAPGVQAI